MYHLRFIKRNKGKWMSYNSNCTGYVVIHNSLCEAIRFSFPFIYKTAKYEI